VKVFRRLKDFVSRFYVIEKLDNSFVFPYSPDSIVKRQQIWANLQKGILLEDRQIFINWRTPFNRVDLYKEQRHNEGDRTLWHLGKRIVLDGYQGQFQVMKWKWLPMSSPITEIFENLGHDSEGMKKFHYLKSYITNLLGDPTTIEIEKFGSFDLGIIQWSNGLVHLTLVGIEHFDCRYSFSIGLIQDQDKKNLDN
jgi:hypothetical protein